jgi:DNA polymerase III delta subunit
VTNQYRAPLGYYWGDDAYSAGRGPEVLAKRLAGDGAPVDRVRLSGASTTIDEIAEKVATGTLFGGGTLIVVSEPSPLMPGKSAVERLIGVLGGVADGNGLAFVDTVDGTNSRPASLKTLRDAVASAGGEVREFKALNAGQLPVWIVDRAREQGIRISPDAARLLAERVGANVRENDIDRRRQGELVLSELAKLAVYRLDGTIGPEDVKALVPEAIPPSVWAFTDAIGRRQAGRAAKLAEELDEKPAPVMIAILHRRLRELIVTGDLLASNAPPAEIARSLGFKLDSKSEFRVGRLAEQARCWSLPELDEALSGLLELDAAFKAREGGSDVRRRAAMTLWIAEKVRRRG